MISKLATDSIRLDQKKPMQIEHYITQAQVNNVADSGEQVQLQSSNYTTRLRRDRVSTGESRHILLTFSFICTIDHPNDCIYC